VINDDAANVHGYTLSTPRSGSLLSESHALTGLCEPVGLSDHLEELQGKARPSLSSWNVVSLSTANRSNAGTSRKENDSAPCRTAAAIPSSGTPARPETPDLRRAGLL
jgi:hypothetical protein